jgi:Quinohemoprotein amine dehydrogenase, alpha subunit domain III
MRNLNLVLALGLTVVGCGTDPTASGVFPAEAFTGTKLRVEISGDATDWKDGAVVSLGDGVTVSSVTVASPTDLFADVTIDAAAAFGLRDVTVSSDGSFTLKQAFAIKSPIEVAFVGDLDQGAFPAFTIINHNFDQPFDTTNLPTVSADGMTFGVGNSTEFSITGFVSIDTDAAGGPVTVDSGAGTTAFTAISEPVMVAARAPTALTAGTPAQGMIATENDTQLYTLPSTANALVHFSISTADANASPVVAILGPSGHWADQLGGGYVTNAPAGTLYAVVFDGGTESGYSFSLTGLSEAVTAAAEGANDTRPGAQDSGSLPFQLTGATLSGGGDFDYIKVTVDAAHANKRIHILTNQGSDALTDTQVDVQNLAGTSYITDPFLGGPGPVDEDSDCSFLGCSNLGEDLLSDPLPAGTYYVEISTAAYSATHNSYVALMWFE